MGPRQGARLRLRFAADDRLVALIRSGDATAFEILYDRHARELLSFCRHMLGSQSDAEDAVQSTFASAHRALLANDRRVEVRPWLFTIARNACLSVLRVRRPLVEVSQASAASDDPVAEVEQREELREVLATLRQLPESQRLALVLSELHGFSQSDIGALMGVRAEQVKSYVYQARSNLASEREARSADCRAIREELATARGAALLKSRLRRHLRICPGCQQFAAELASQRRLLGSLLPVLPSLALKRRALEASLNRANHPSTYSSAVASSGSAATATAELAGGGAKALVAKLLAGIACLGAGTGATTLVLSAPVAPTQLAASSASRFAQPLRRSLPQAVAPTTPAASSPTAGAPGAGATNTQQGHQSLTLPAHDNASQGDSASTPASSSSTGEGSGTSTSEAPHRHSEEAPGHGHSEEAPGHGHSKEAPEHGKSEEAPGHGKGEEAHGKGEEPHGKSEEAPGHAADEASAIPGSSEEPRGGSEETHGKSEEAHGKNEEAHGAPGG